MNINDLTITPINPSMDINYNQNNNEQPYEKKKNNEDNLIFQRILDEELKKQGVIIHLAFFTIILIHLKFLYNKYYHIFLFEYHNIYSFLCYDNHKHTNHV